MIALFTMIGCIILFLCLKVWNPHKYRVVKVRKDDTVMFNIEYAMGIKILRTWHKLTPETSYNRRFIYKDRGTNSIMPEKGNWYFQEDAAKFLNEIKDVLDGTCYLDVKRKTVLKEI